MNIIKLNSSVYFEAIVIEQPDGKIVMYNPIPKDIRDCLIKEGVITDG